MILHKTKYLLGASLLLGSSFLAPASAFAAGGGTNGLSFYDYLSTQADKDTVIDFNEAPATGNLVDDNGAVISDIGGLYMLQSTKDDDKPMYFFRGNVENNNVILNDMCWLIVRTTETGGTKLLYNGTPTDGQCLGDPDWSLEKINNFNPDDTSTWPKTIAGISAFNEQYTSPADFGYMYGDRFESTQKSFSSSTVFGNDVTYANGQYTLTDVVTGAQSASNAHHYTCLTTETTCSEVYYATYQSGGYATSGYFLTLTDGDTLDTALAKMAESTNDSKIKTFIENWYAENMTDATEYLEDTIWYGGKTFASGALSTKDSNFGSNFDANGYSYTKEAIDTYYHGASREDDSALTNSTMNDVSFDYSDENGIYTVANGTLKYPVGMLTNSEMIMAGNGYPAYAKGTYIDDDFVWWGLSPFAFRGNGARSGFFYGLDGRSNYGDVYASVGVRPSVSLKSTLGALDGDGSRENPFTGLQELSPNDGDNEDTDGGDEGGETTPDNPQTVDGLVFAILSLFVLMIGSHLVKTHVMSRKN